MTWPAVVLGTAALGVVTVWILNATQRGQGYAVSIHPATGLMFTVAPTDA